MISLQHSGVIERPRLIEKLKSAAQYRLTLLSAPPGYGKTTLAAQFMEQSPYPMVWHTIEEAERDIPMLYRRCLDALTPHVPSIRELPTSHGFLPDELAALVTTHLKTHLKKPIFYLLDDVHHLGRSPQAESWLRTFVSTAPANLHLIMISRIIPDVPMTEMISRSEVLAIGQEELRLTQAEIETLSRNVYPEGLPAEKVHEIEERLEGWPAGTVLALRPLPAELERAMLRGGSGPEALFDSLAASMLSALPPDLRDFLLASSTLTRLTPQLCSACLQLPDGANALSQVLERNLFLTRSHGGLVYHALFRGFLQQQLKQNDPDLYVTLHTRAAYWFEEQNQINQAIDHSIEAGLIERAANLAEQVAQAYFAQGNFELLLHWNRRLQEHNVEAPRLLGACAKIYIERYEYDAADHALYLAHSVFTKRRDKTGVAEITVTQAMLNLQKGLYSEASTLAQQFIEHASLGGRALRTLGVSHLYLGQMELAARYLEQAVPVYRADGDNYALSHLLQDLQAVYNRLGDVKRASELLQEVVALRRSLASQGALALALNNLGCHYHQHSDYDQALKTLHEGLSVVARGTNRRAETYLLWSLGDVQRDRGNFDEARQLYAKALELLDENEPPLRCAVLMSMSALRRWQGHFTQAAQLANEAGELAEKHDLRLEKPVAQMHLWAARANLGRMGEALTHLEKIASALRENSQTVELAQALILCGLAAQRCGSTPQAKTFVQASLLAARDLWSMQPLAAEVFHTPTLQSLLTSDMQGYTAFVRDLNKLREEEHQAQPSRHTNHTMTDTFSVRVYTLGTDVIERDGVRVPQSAWQSAKAKEIFLYLLFKGAQTKEQICLEIWPDSSAKKGRQNFHTTMNRARQAIGKNVIHYEDEVYCIHSEVDVWCDAREIETLTKQQNHLSRRDPRAEDLLRRAVTLYKGDFLLSLDYEWADNLRETLREAHFQALHALAECARARDDFRAAIDHYKRALAIDPYREDITRMVMTCYGNLGERSQIRNHFDKLRTVLREDLATEPSAETQALAKTLLA